MERNQIIGVERGEKTMFKYHPRLTRTDKLLLLAIAGCFLAPHLAVWAMEDAAYRAAEADKPPRAITITAPTIDCASLVAAIEERREELFWADVPLDKECREALQESCEAEGVPICLALGVIYEESRFDAYAENKFSYGYMVLNKKYYPDNLTPEGNIQMGVAHLATQIERYDGDIQAALRAYNKGWDDGDRRYARSVLDASEKWGCG